MKSSFQLRRNQLEIVPPSHEKELGLYEEAEDVEETEEEEEEDTEEEEEEEGAIQEENTETEGNLEKFGHDRKIVPIDNIEEEAFKNVVSDPDAFREPLVYPYPRIRNKCVNGKPPEMLKTQDIWKMNFTTQRQYLQDVHCNDPEPSLTSTNKFVEYARDAFIRAKNGEVNQKSNEFWEVPADMVQTSFDNISIKPTSINLYHIYVNKIIHRRKKLRIAGLETRISNTE
jgi:hypothetical protein